MAKKFQLQWNDNTEHSFVWESLRLPPDRAKDLEFRMELIIHEMTKPVKNIADSPGSDQLIKLFMSLAENPQELAFVSYCAGIAVPKIWVDNEFEEEFDDYEEEDI